MSWRVIKNNSVITTIAMNGANQVADRSQFKSHTPALKTFKEEEASISNSNINTHQDIRKNADSQQFMNIDKYK